MPLTANSSTDFTEALSAPLGDLIAAIGRGTAEAQEALDAQTLHRYKAILGSHDGDELLQQLRRMGYEPTWYRIPEVEADVSVSLSISGDTRRGRRVRSSLGVPSPVSVYAATTDASFTNKFNYSVNASSRVKFKIVAVPPSPQAAEALAAAPLSSPRPENRAVTPAGTELSSRQMDILRR